MLIYLAFVFVLLKEGGGEKSWYTCMYASKVYKAYAVPVLCFYKALFLKGGNWVSSNMCIVKGRAGVYGLRGSLFNLLFPFHPRI